MVTKCGFMQWRVQAHRDDATSRIWFRFCEQKEAAEFQVVEDIMEWKVQAVLAASPCMLTELPEHARTQELCLVRDGPAVPLLQAAALRGFRKLTVPFLSRLYDLCKVGREGASLERRWRSWTP